VHAEWQPATRAVCCNTLTHKQDNTGLTEGCAVVIAATGAAGGPIYKLHVALWTSSHTPVRICIRLAVVPLQPLLPHCIQHLQSISNTAQSSAQVDEAVVDVPDRCTAGSLETYWSMGQFDMLTPLMLHAGHSHVSPHQPRPARHHPSRHQVKQHNRSILVHGSVLLANHQTEQYEG
jgi:hypothetical protein